MTAGQKLSGHHPTDETGHPGHEAADQRSSIIA
jgi:hypothetical protein